MVHNKDLFQDKFYLGFLGITIISLLLPWIKIPIVGGVSAINNWKGLVGFFLLIGIAGLYFYKKRYSYLASLSLVGGVSLYAIYSLLKIVFTSVDLGIFGEFSPLLFVGVGIYFFIIGGIGVTIKSFIELRKSKDEYFKYAMIGAVVLFAIILLTMNLGNFTSAEPTIADDLFDTGNSKPEQKMETKEYSLGDSISYNGVELKTINFEYDDTSDDQWSFESSAYVLSFEIKNTNNEEITNCDFSFDYINSDGEQIYGSDYYGGYAEIYSNAKESYEVRFTDSNNGKTGTIYIKPTSYSDEHTCPNFKIKIKI